MVADSIHQIHTYTVQQFNKQTPMLLYGASGHAKVLVSILRAAGQEVSAIFDDDLDKKDLGNVPVIGSYDPNHQPATPFL